MQIKPRFIHFVVDDKFIPDSIKCFQDANLTNNKFYYLTENPSAVSFIGKTIVEYINIKQLEDVISQLKKDDVVVLHCLYALPARFICLIPDGVKVIWYAWGFDLYSNEYPIKPLIELDCDRLLPATKSKVKGLILLKELLRRYRVLTDTKGYHTKSASEQYKAISRIDYFAGVFLSEHQLLREQCKYFRAKRIVHDYIHPEEFAAKDINEPTVLTGNNVLLGNSAAFLCNHIDILRSLYNQTKNHNFDIYCPLSYGDNAYYVKQVIKEGTRLFGNHFKPMLKYLPFDEYTKIIQSCGSIILGHQRQAATCNCLTSLWNGLKLFLPQTSMNYEEYKNVEGLKVFSLENDLNDDALKMNIEQDLRKQREIISSIYSYERWVENLRNSINIIFGD